MLVPWSPTNGQTSKWNAPARWEAIEGLRIAQDGYMAVKPWRRILQYIPSSGHLAHGTKARWDKWEGDELESIEVDRLAEWGATEQLIEKIKTGQWAPLIDGAGEVLEAIKTHGYEAVEKPRVMVGTIHSAKGMEADNVYLLTTLSHQVAKGMETQAGADEERRVQYVGVTRTRKRLTILDERDVRHAMELPV
jgi:superfamily I DNA/RNA helicase